MSEELDLQAILSQDNPDIDVFSNAAPSPEPAPVAAVAEPVVDPEAPAAPIEPVAPEDPRQANAFAEMRRAMQEKSELAAQLAAANAVAERDRQWQASLQQGQQQQRDEKPDMFVDPDAYEAWQARETDRKIAAVEAKFEQREQARVQADQAKWQQDRMTEAGVPVETIHEAVAHIRATQPWMLDGLNRAPNPYKAALDYAQTIGFAGAAAKPAAPPTPSGISDQVRQQVLAEEAAKRAAAGQPPQIQTPRGVGSVANGAGFADTQPPPADYARLAKDDPTAWQELKNKILSQ